MPSSRLRAVGPGGMTGKRGANDGTEGISEYQTRALEAFSRWLAALAEARRESAAGIEALRKARVDVPSDVRNYPKAVAEAGAGRRGRRRQHADRTADVGFPFRTPASRCRPMGWGQDAARRDGAGEGR